MIPTYLLCCASAALQLCCQFCTVLHCGTTATLPMHIPVSAHQRSNSSHIGLHQRVSVNASVGPKCQQDNPMVALIPVVVLPIPPTRVRGWYSVCHCLQLCGNQPAKPPLTFIHLKYAPQCSPPNYWLPWEFALVFHYPKCAIAGPTLCVPGPLELQHPCLWRQRLYGYIIIPEVHPF